MISDKLNIQGFVLAELGRDNKITQRLDTHNLVTQAGKNIFANRILGYELEKEISDIGIGIGNDPATLQDSALDVEVANLPIFSSEVENNIVILFTTFPEGVGIGTITEVGLFASDGTLLCRTVLTVPFEKTSADFLNITWKLQIG